MKTKLTKEIDTIPLMTPNFILTGEDRTPIPISEFTEDELREMCMEFTENLIKKAKSKSNN